MYPRYVLQHRNVSCECTYIVAEGLETKYPLLIYAGVPANEYVRYNSNCDLDRKSTRLNSSHSGESRMPSSA